MGAKRPCSIDSQISASSNDEMDSLLTLPRESHSQMGPQLAIIGMVGRCSPSVSCIQKAHQAIINRLARLRAPSSSDVGENL